MTQTTTAATWILSEYGQGSTQHRVYRLTSNVVTVGRSSAANLRINAQCVSKTHARITINLDHVLVEDLQSTNGTHVNGSRVEVSRLVEGDLLQFGNALFRVGREAVSHQDATAEEGLVPWAKALLKFDQLIADRAVVPNFQPIVDMRQRDAKAYELLARSNMPELATPVAMFGAAERLGHAATLSELMRSEGVRKASQAPLRTQRSS